MNDETFNTMLGRAGQKWLSTPPIADVTPWVLDDIRRSAGRRDEIVAWRWASSVAALVAVVGLFAAVPAWQHLENPLSDFASVMPGADQ